jgi:hypothetical protein
MLKAKISEGAMNRGADADTAAHHYHSRLVSTVFGQWISYVVETKALEVDAESIALLHYRPAVLETAMFRLKWMQFIMNKHRYNNILASIGRSFLLQKRGLRCLTRRMREARSGMPNPAFSSNLKKIGHVDINRLFVRWKSKTDVASKVGRAFRCAVSPATGKQSLLVMVEALKRWQRFTAGSLQTNRVYDTGKRWFLQSLKKKYLCKFLAWPNML